MKNEKTVNQYINKFEIVVIAILRTICDMKTLYIKIILNVVQYSGQLNQVNIFLNVHSFLHSHHDICIEICLLEITSR